MDGAYGVATDREQARRFVLKVFTRLARYFAGYGSQRVLANADVRRARASLSGPQAPERATRRPYPRCFHVSCRLAVNEARLTLPNFYNVTIRIANVAACLAVLRDRLCDELRTSTFP
jgi:hypothetical protein